MKALHAKVSRPPHGKVMGASSPLPGWAQRCPEVVTLCESNSQFKRNVLNATDPRYKRVLIQKARQIVRGFIRL